MRQVLQLEWVIVGGMRDVFLIGAGSFVVLGGNTTLGTSRVFVVRVSRKGSVIEECGCLSYHASIVESWYHLGTTFMRCII